MPESISAKAKLISTIKEYQNKLQNIEAPVDRASEIKNKVENLLKGLLDLLEHNNFTVDLVGLMGAINNKSGQWFIPNVTPELIPLAKLYLELISTWLRDETNEKIFSNALGELNPPWGAKKVMFALAKTMLQGTFDTAKKQGITELARVGVQQIEMDQITGDDVAKVTLRGKSVRFKHEQTHFDRMTKRASVLVASSTFTVVNHLSNLVTTLAPIQEETTTAPATISPPSVTSVAAPITDSKKSWGVYAFLNYATHFVPESMKNNVGYISAVCYVYASFILPSPPRSTATIHSTALSTPLAPLTVVPAATPSVSMLVPPPAAPTEEVVQPGGGPGVPVEEAAMRLRIGIMDCLYLAVASTFNCLLEKLSLLVAMLASLAKKIFTPVEVVAEAATMASGR